ncbi:CU044_5270 family protein [Nonomuraea sp. NPDC050404]|uniref:CU044_5270 family protein n=1 Tax=Nonomuraea sp. NPDC050404 TaxID=3155783 RepID=UPI0033E5EF3C
MDDLKTLATVLTKPEPPAEALTRSRSRLEDRIHRAGAAGRTRGRARWFVPALAAGAAAVAAAVVILPAGLPADRRDEVATTAVAPDAARQILLVAAETAERTPQATGAYWHVRREGADGELFGESWITRDGQRWSKGRPGRGPGVTREPDALFSIAPGGPKMSVVDLNDLPTDPEELKRWATETQREADGVWDKRLLPLTALVSELPTPAKVRAAAFRALATLPGARSLGATEGGEGLLISGGLMDVRLVIDPATSRITATNVLPTEDGGVMFSVPERLTRLTTGWTDRPPR